MAPSLCAWISIVQFHAMLQKLRMNRSIQQTWKKHLGETRDFSLRFAPFEMTKWGTGQEKKLGAKGEVEREAEQKKQSARCFADEIIQLWNRIQEMLGRK